MGTIKVYVSILEWHVARRSDAVGRDLDATHEAEWAEQNAPAQAPGIQDACRGIQWRPIAVPSVLVGPI